MKNIFAKKNAVFILSQRNYVVKIAPNKLNIKENVFAKNLKISIYVMKIVNIKIKQMDVNNIVIFLLGMKVNIIVE